ncbi:MAG TPA: MlaD family protein [Isosphaeraceae bacterium]|nr:MlaD family protein [Isosphaeraceae bacterium]
MSRTSMREVRAGLVVLVGLVALGGLLSLAAGGPGFLTSRRVIDIVFKDGQGIRPGCPVRVAGIDAGRVTSVELSEYEGVLHAHVRILMPEEIAERLRQDVQITVESGLTGQSMINVVSSGRSKVALVRGQVVRGVESSFFDPILEQVGLGPVERTHLSHTIAEVRETVDAAGPRLRTMLAALQEASTEMKDTMASVRPRIESTMAEVETLARGVDDAKIQDAIERVHRLIAQLDATLAETRPVALATLQNVEGLTGNVDNLLKANRGQIDALMAGMNATRTRLDAVLANTEVLTGQGAQILTKNRADVDRIVANVKDTTGYGLKLVQKIYGNPFYLSPFYKPKPEDIRAEEMYDAANTFLLGAKEFADALKTLQAMQGHATTKLERDAYNDLFKRAWELTGMLGRTQSQLAERLQQNTPQRR